MLRAAIAFFVIGLLAIALGANNIGGVSIDLGRTLLTIFVVLAIISFIASLLMGKKTGVLSLFLAFGLLGAFGLNKPAIAAESTTDKISDTATDAKTGTKKSFRTAKRQVRKATGNDNVLKDTKDKVNDVGDDANGSIEKAKRHAQ